MRVPVCNGAWCVRKLASLLTEHMQFALHLFCYGAIPVTVRLRLRIFFLFFSSRGWTSECCCCFLFSCVCVCGGGGVDEESAVQYKANAERVQPTKAFMPF